MTENCAKKPNVLVSAFVCEPNCGSEPGVGWGWVQEMSKHANVTAVTQAKNKGRIERYLECNPNNRKNIEYVYLAPRYGLEKMRKVFRIPYYILWQWALRRWIVRSTSAGKQFDLMHHVTFASFRYPLFLKNLNSPVVWGPIGGAENAPDELLAGRGSVLARFKEKLRNMMKILSCRMIAIMDPTDGGANGKVLSSTPAMQEICRQKNIKSEIMPTIGIQDCVFDRAKSSEDKSIGGDGVRILYVGRLHILKGVDLLIKSLVMLVDYPWHLDIIGDGRERVALEKLTSDLGLSNRVTFLGHKQQTELEEQFQNHHLLVAPSLYESGGMVAIEAMVYSCPVVALDVGGHQLSVADGCGLRVASSVDVNSVIEDLSEAIRYYLEEPSRMIRHGKTARKNIGSNYLWSLKGKQMYAVYREIIDSRSS